MDKSFWCQDCLLRVENIEQIKVFRHDPRRQAISLPSCLHPYNIWCHLLLCEWLSLSFPNFLCIFAFALQEPILLLLLIGNIFFSTWVCYHIYYYQGFLHSFPIFGIKSKVTVASPEKTWILSLALPLSLLCFTWMVLRFHLAPVVRQLLSCLRDLAGLCLLPRTFSLHSTLHLDDAASCFCYHVLW